MKKSIINRSMIIKSNTIFFIYTIVINDSKVFINKRESLRYLGLFSLAPYPRSGVVELTRWRFGGLLSPMFLGVDQTLCGCSGVSKSPASSISPAGTYNSFSIYSRSRISATLLPCRFASF